MSLSRKGGLLYLPGWVAIGSNERTNLKHSVRCPALGKWSSLLYSLQGKGVRLKFLTYKGIHLWGWHEGIVPQFLCAQHYFSGSRDHFFLDSHHHLLVPVHVFQADGFDPALHLQGWEWSRPGQSAPFILPGCHNWFWIRAWPKLVQWNPTLGLALELWVQSWAASCSLPRGREGSNQQ